MNTRGHGLGPTRAEVLQFLQSAATPKTVLEVADELFLHKNSARFHLEKLVELGYANRDSQPAKGKGRPSLVYRATGLSPNVTNAHLLDLSRVLINSFVADQPDAMNRAESAGYSWGESESFDNSGMTVEQHVSNLAHSMAERGFSTERNGTCISFTRCPFRAGMPANDLAFVCALHQGFIRGYLDHSGSGLEAEDLEIGPDVCRVQLNSKQQLSPAAG